MRLASQVDHRLMPRLLVVLFAFAQLHSTAAFALVMRPTLPLAKAKSMRAELRMAESSSDPGLKFFQAGVLPTVAAQLGCTALVVAATLHPGPLHDFAPLWHLFPPAPVGGSQVAPWASANPAFWLRWGLWFGCLLYFYSQLELEVTTTDADVSSAIYSATEVEPVDIGPSKSLPLGGYTVVQSWFWAVQASWWTAWCLERSPELLSSVINLATCFSVLLLLGLATYALIIGPEFPAASRLAVDKKSAASRLSLTALCLVIFGLYFGYTLFETLETSGVLFSWGFVLLEFVFLGGAILAWLSVPFISSARLWFEILVVRDEESISADSAAVNLYERTMSLFLDTGRVVAILQFLSFSAHRV